MNTEFNLEPHLILKIILIININILITLLKIRFHLLIIKTILIIMIS